MIARRQVSLRAASLLLLHSLFGMAATARADTVVDRLSIPGPISFNASSSAILLPAPSIIISAKRCARLASSSVHSVKDWSVRRTWYASLCGLIENRRPRSLETRNFERADVTVDVKMHDPPSL